MGARFPAWQGSRKDGYASARGLPARIFSFTVLFPCCFLLLLSYYGWGFLCTSAVLFGSVSIVCSCIESPNKGLCFFATQARRGPAAYSTVYGRALRFWIPMKAVTPTVRSTTPAMGSACSQKRGGKCAWMDGGKTCGHGEQKQRRKSRAGRALNHPKSKLANAPRQCRARLEEMQTKDSQEARSYQPTCKQTTPKKHAHTSRYICPDQHWARNDGASPSAIKR